MIHGTIFVLGMVAGWIVRGIKEERDYWKVRFGEVKEKNRTGK